MTGTEMFDAIAHIDEDLIDGCRDRMKARSSERRANAKAGLGDGRKHSELRRALIACAALAAAAVLAVGLIAVLHVGGKSPTPIGPGVTDTPAPTEAPTEAPTPEPTEAPTPEPTEEPTPEPTEEPIPSEEWFLDEAWKLAEVVNSLYGTTFEKDECESRPAAWGVKSLRWYHADLDVTLNVSFVKNDDGDWVTGMDRVSFYYETVIDRVDAEKYDNDIINLYGLSLSITADDLKKTGYEPDGSDEDLDMAARYMANYVAGLFTGLSEDNYFKCRDAGTAKLERYSDEDCTHWAWIALMPADYSNWGAAYADIDVGLCADPEYYGYITIWMNINVVRNDDGSFEASLDFNSY